MPYHTEIAVALTTMTCLSPFVVLGLVVARLKK